MTHRTKYGWMALGGLLCLFGVVAAVKWRDGGKVLAQGGLPPIAAETSEPPKMPTPGAPKSEMPPWKNPEIQLTGGTTPAPLSMPPSQPALGSDTRPISIPASAVQTPPADFAPPSPPCDPLPKAPSAPAMTPPSQQPVELPKPTPAPPMWSDSRDAQIQDYMRHNTPAKMPEVTPVKVETPKDHVNEPPLAPTPGPVISYQVPKAGETFRSLAKKTLNNAERWVEIHKLNPNLKHDATLPAGAVVKLPADACVSDDEALRPLPVLQPRPPLKPRALAPLTGTYPLTLDDNKGLTLPKAILAQLGNADAVLVSPGSDRCLWLTNQAHLDRLAAKLDKSPAREADVRNFKRLYYAQTAKVPVKDGRVALGDKLAQFAGLHQELVLVGIDDHFEVWDANRWRRYTQAKKATTTDE